MSAPSAGPLSFWALFWNRRTLPFVMQSEASECGLACLAMVGRYYGHKLDLISLRRRFSNSVKGMRLDRLVHIARELNLATRPVRIELDDLPYVRLPCILHWNLNHFVVLKECSEKKATIYDPASGPRNLPLSDLSRSFTGIAIEIWPLPQFAPEISKEKITITRLTGEIVGLRSAVAQILLLALSLELVSILGPILPQWILDQVLSTHDVALLQLLGTAFVCVTLFQVFIGAARSWALSWVEATINTQWLVNVFHHVLQLPMPFFQRRPVGDIISRFGSISIIQSALSTKFIEALLDGLTAIGTITMLFLYSFPLALIVLLVFGLYALMRYAFFWPLRRASEQQISYDADQQTQLMEVVRGAQTVKQNNMQAARGAQFANLVVATTNRKVELQKLQIGMTAASQMVLGIGRICLLWLGAELVLDDKLTVGMLVAVVAYGEQFVSRAASLIDKGSDFGLLAIHAERLSDVVLTAPERHCEGRMSAAVSPQITVDNISFRYAADDEWVIRNFSMQVAAGESVAVIGPSGSGKSTLAKLLLGLLEPESGSILIGGIDIREIGLNNYRDMVAAVLQDDQLFAGSIRDNICFFVPPENDDAIEAAARIAGIHDEIVAMPMGYETLVGDMGSVLSGGQKQRVLLARALYRAPQVLVLDEATSHLDVEREAQVTMAIREQRATRIIIAHRPQTIASADRVISLADLN
ncbi:MAG: peptidase domain-containing ABC transporter [Rhizomicrobium sp.]